MMQGGYETKSGEPRDKIVYVSESSAFVENDESIDFGKLVCDVWVRKWWIIGVTALVTSLAIAYSLLATEWFRAEAVMIPRDSAVGSRLASGLAQFGGLADLAGINVASNAKQEPLGVLRSKGFVQRFIEHNDLMDELEAARDGVLVRTLHGDQPDIREVVDEFMRSIFSVSEDKKTGLVTITIKWRDPLIAAEWANTITRQINAEARKRALDESNRNISYLQGQLAKTETVSLQQAIARLLESEMQKVMIAQGTDEYAFRIIDQAHPPSERFRPKRTLTVVLAFLIGLIVSTVGVLVVDQLRVLVATTKARMTDQGG